MKKDIYGFMTLKNNDGNDIYTIDVVDETLIISPLIPYIDIFQPLTLSVSNFTEKDNDNYISICDINMSEVLINAIIEKIERTAKNDTICNKVADTFSIKYPIKMRSIKDCFPKICFDGINSLCTLKAFDDKSRVQDNDFDFNNNISEALKTLFDLGKTQSNVMTEPKIGVNDPCHCKSGKKFKKCCGMEV